MKNAMSSIMLLYCLIGVLGIAHATVINGDFSNELNGWTIEEDVMIDNGIAVIGDTFADPLAFSSALYQGIAVTPGQYEYHFDFKNQLSADIPTSDPFAFSDTAFFSLYFANDAASIAAFPPTDFVALFDLDAAGPFFVDANVIFTSQGDWTHVSYTFNNQFAYAMPAFELLDFNFISGDSLLLIDNVSLNKIVPPSTVPNPSVLWLMLIGLGLIRTRRRSSLVAVK